MADSLPRGAHQAVRDVDAPRALSVDHEQEWVEFAIRLRQRLEAGAKQYGDVSFRRDLGELTGEIEQGLLDVCGWAFVLWCRLRRLPPLMRRGLALERCRRKPQLTMS